MDSHQDCSLDELNNQLPTNDQPHFRTDSAPTNFQLPTHHDTQFVAVIEPGFEPYFLYPNGDIELIPITSQHHPQYQLTQSCSINQNLSNPYAQPDPKTTTKIKVTKSQSLQPPSPTLPNLTPSKLHLSQQNFSSPRRSIRQTRSITSYVSLLTSSDDESIQLPPPSFLLNNTKKSKNAQLNQDNSDFASTDTASDESNDDKDNKSLETSRTQISATKRSRTTNNATTCQNITLSTNQMARKKQRIISPTYLFDDDSFFSPILSQQRNLQQCNPHQIPATTSASATAPAPAPAATPAPAPSTMPTTIKPPILTTITPSIITTPIATGSTAPFTTTTIATSSKNTFPLSKFQQSKKPSKSNKILVSSAGSTTGNLFDELNDFENRLRMHHTSINMTDEPLSNPYNTNTNTTGTNTNELSHEEQLKKWTTCLDELEEIPNAPNDPSSFVLPIKLIHCEIKVEADNRQRAAPCIFTSAPAHLIEYEYLLEPTMSLYPTLSSTPNNWQSHQIQPSPQIINFSSQNNASFQSDSQTNPFLQGFDSQPHLNNNNNNNTHNSMLHHNTIFSQNDDKYLPQLHGINLGNILFHTPLQKISSSQPPPPPPPQPQLPTGGRFSNLFFELDQSQDSLETTHSQLKSGLNDNAQAQNDENNENDGNNGNNGNNKNDTNDTNDSNCINDSNGINDSNDSNNNTSCDKNKEMNDENETDSDVEVTHVNVKETLDPLLFFPHQRYLCAQSNGYLTSKHQHLKINPHTKCDLDSHENFISSISINPQYQPLSLLQTTRNNNDSHEKSNTAIRIMCKKPTTSQPYPAFVWCDHCFCLICDAPVDTCGNWKEHFSQQQNCDKNNQTAKRFREMLNFLQQRSMLPSQILMKQKKTKTDKFLNNEDTVRPQEDNVAVLQYLKHPPAGFFSTGTNNGAKSKSIFALFAQQKQ